MLLAQNHDSNIPEFKSSFFDVEKHLNRLGIIIYRLFGVFGILILAILSIVFAPFLWLWLRNRRKSLRKGLNKVVDALPFMEPSDVVDLHLELEGILKMTNEIQTLPTQKVPLVWRYIFKEFDYVERLFSETERIVYRAAYPDINNTPDTSELEYLEDQISPIKEELSDPDLDIYKQHYIK